MGKVAASIKVVLLSLSISRVALLIRGVIFPQDIKPAKEM